MVDKIILGIDSECAKNPSYLNLSKSDLESSWLKVFTNAKDLRKFINSCEGSCEVWISSSDDMEAINLAAAIKKDREDCVVCLISFDMSGSLKSRSEAANLDNILNINNFKERFESYRYKFESDKNNSENKFKYDNDKTKKAFVMSVFSASGGAGKSTVSVMSAVLAQSCGYNTLIIDCDWQLGDISFLMGINNALKIEDLVSDKSLIGQLKQKTGMPCVLAPPSYPELSEKLLEEFPEIFEILKNMFDIIIVNTGSYWNELQALLLERDSKSLFLVDQRPTSLNATKTALSLCGRCGIATGSVLFALNKCSKQALFSSVDISCIFQGMPVVEIMDGGIDVDEYLSEGKPFELIKIKNSFAVSLWSVLEKIFPKQEFNDSDKLNFHTRKKEKKRIRPSVNSKKTGLLSRNRA